MYSIFLLCGCDHHNHDFLKTPLQMLLQHIINQTTDLCGLIFNSYFVSSDLSSRQPFTGVYRRKHVSCNEVQVYRYNCFISSTTIKTLPLILLQIYHCLDLQDLSRLHLISLDILSFPVVMVVITLYLTHSLSLPPPLHPASKVLIALIFHPF